MKSNSFFECVLGQNKVDLTKTPTKGSFSVNACHGILIMRYYSALAEI